MTVKLYVRNDSDIAISINTKTGADIDTNIIAPGDAGELIFDDDATELAAKTITQDAIKAINEARFPAAGEPFTVELRGFSKTNPTNATVGRGQDGKLKVGDEVALTQTEGEADALPAATAIVLETNVHLVTLDLDMSEANVWGLKAKALVTPPEPPAEPPAPAPAPAPEEPPVTP
jgi:hypothetical protein